MRARDLLGLIWTNLNRMRFRAVLSASGVAIGTAAVVILISLAAGLQRSATQDLATLGPLTEIQVMSGAALQIFGAAPQPGSQQAVLTPAFLRELEGRPGVVAVTPREPLMGSPTLRLGRLMGFTSLTGVEPQALQRLNWEVQRGALRLGRFEAVVGARVAEAFVDPTRPVMPGPLQPEDLLGQTLTLELSRQSQEGGPATRAFRLRVVGVLAPRGGQDDYTIFLALGDVEELNHWLTGRRPNRAREGYSEAVVIMESVDQVQPLEQELIERGFFAFSAGTVLRQINTFFLVLQAILGGIGGIALLVAGLGIANTLTMAIYERTREIGLMKAVGATNRDVMSVFLGEAGAIGASGGAVGVLVGVLVSQLVESVGRLYLAQAGGGAVTEATSAVEIAAIPLWLPLLALAFATGMGVLSGVYPAQRAASLDPVAALRHE